MVKNPLEEEKIGKLLRSYAVPSVISMLVGALYNIVDQFFIGRSVGMLGNAATNVAFPLSTLCTAAALLFGVGGAATFSLKLGAKKEEEAATAVGNAATLLCTVGVTISVLVLIFLRPLMRAFGATEDVLTYALTYTGITAYGFPFLIFTTGGTALVRADGSPRYSMLCTLTGAVLNTILDPLLIFKFQMGMAGAAIATVTGQVVSAVMVAAYLFRYKSVHLQKRHFALYLQDALKIASLGTSHCFNQLAMMIVQIVMNNTMTHYGAQSVYGSEIPLACSGIISKVTMIFFSFVIGISQGLQPIAGYNYGAKKYARVRKTLRLALAFGTGIAVTFYVVFQVFPRQIIGLFGTGDETYFAFAERYIRVFLMALFLDAIQPISSNFFTSIGKAKKGILLSLTRQVIFLLPLLLVLPIFFGLDGAMYAGPIADTVAALLSGMMVVKEFRKMRKIEQQTVAVPAEI
ncbi:MAG: MATE family efflux transporter [Candidatus Fimenecus sp.]